MSLSDSDNAYDANTLDDSIASMLQEIECLHTIIKHDAYIKFMKTFFQVFTICIIMALFAHVMKTRSLYNKDEYTAYDILLVMYISLYI